ncbi:hypothetical protein INR49_016816 [Caranx melampygus]|nr:hypothetical protein INR49_016816 [Caranx melampygus]
MHWVSRASYLPYLGNSDCFFGSINQESEVLGSNGEPDPRKTLETLLVDWPDAAEFSQRRHVRTHDFQIRQDSHSHTYLGSVYQRRTAKETQRTLTSTTRTGQRELGLKTIYFWFLLFYFVFGEKSSVLFSFIFFYHCGIFFCIPGIKLSVVYIQSYSSLLFGT